MTKPLESLSTEDAVAFQQAISDHVLAILAANNFKPEQLTLLPQESGYLYAIIDAANQAALLIGLDGVVYAPKLSLATGSVGASQLSASLLDLIPTVMNGAETGYVWGIVDAAGKIGLALTTSGQLVAPGLQIPAGAIDRAQLSPALSPYVATALSPESGYVWAVVDAVGNIAIGITTAGQVVGNMSGALGPGVVQTSMIAPNAITEALLSAALDLSLIHI